MVKIWHKEFIEYMDYIVNHANYQDMPLETKKDNTIKWIAGKKTDLGKLRINWIQELAKKMDIEIKPGFYSKVMYQIHPTKEKPCQICGQYMSLSYIYPNYHLLNFLSKEYNFIPDIYDSIFIIYDKLNELELDTNILISYLLEKSNIVFKSEANLTNIEILKLVEKQCRIHGNKLLGPGAMSNFPDRLDGFHSYNRCCRAKEDSGRSKENLKTYTKDRRAYEYWSDGNIHAANKFMKHESFKGNTADHIGPISLGFIHDSLFFQKMDGRDNSSKRDRLTIEDIEKLIMLEERYQKNCASKYSKLVWEELKKDFKINDNFNIQYWQDKLKLNTLAYMKLLSSIVQIPDKVGEVFLIENIIKPKMEYFKYDYTFNEFGYITNTTKRRINDANKKEFERFVKISIDSIYDFKEKTNRKRKIIFSNSINNEIDKFKIILESKLKANLLEEFDKIVENLQLSIIHEETK